MIRVPLGGIVKEENEKRIWYELTIVATIATPSAIASGRGLLRFQGRLGECVDGVRESNERCSSNVEGPVLPVLR